MDYNEVSVVVTVDNVANAVNMSPGCSSGLGFQFLYEGGSTDIPSHIELCPTTCNTVQGTAGVELNVEFPCGTVIY